MLLDTAHAESQGLVEIVAGQFDKSGKLVIADHAWFNMPDEFEEMVNYVETNSETNLYFTPSTFKTRKRTPDQADLCSIVYIDADTCEPGNFRAHPSFTVETSPGHYQCYWMLDQAYPTAQVSELARKISHGHKDQGCDTSSWPMNKIMRVPGSVHSKSQPHHRVTLTESTGEPFTLDELVELYSDVEVTAVVSVEDTPMGTLPNAAEVASKIPDEIMDIFLAGAPEGADRSAVRFRFESDLFEHGFTAEEVFVAVQRAGGGLDKFTPQGRPNSLWHEVLKARATAGNGGQEPEPLVEEHMPGMDQISFLSPEEREWTENNPTFVDEYTAWVKTRSPQSAETYQRSLAFSVLSCVYGNWGYVVPQFGPMKLNLWLIIAGDTTKTRKSTARALALEVLHHWERRSGKIVDIGSDATAEALMTTLADRDGEVSLLHRDEFQGWIKEMFTKNYLQGLAERLTELYDGKVTQVLRNTKGSGNNKRAETVFNMLMLGIQDKIADVLTSENFASGFLPRFLWSVAEPPEWKESDEFVGQLDGDEDFTRADDPEVLRFSNQFELARRKWNSTTPKRILADEETWARWNQWKVDSKQFILGRQNEQIMEPARDRMSYSILKAAALLAIHGRSDTIRMEHLLPVLAQAEWWFADMMHMAHRISASAFEANVDKMEKMIASKPNGVMKRSDIHRSKDFKGMRVGEVDEHIRSLLASNRAKTDTIDGVPVLVVNQAE